MLVTCIPGHNSNPERLKLITESFDSIVFESLSDSLKFLITKRHSYSYVEVWYPQHFPMLIIAKCLGKRTIFSPVTNSSLWFEIEGFWKISKAYTVRRCLNWLFEFFVLLLSDCVLVQDSSLLQGWRKRYRGNFLAVVNNLMPEVRFDYARREGFLALGNLEPHKYFHLYNLIDKDSKLVWYGKGSDVFSIPNAIEYRGKLSREQVREKYLEYAILVHPSCYEGSPRVIYEAIAHGMIVRVHQDLKGLCDLKEFFKEAFDPAEEPVLNNEFLQRRVSLWNDSRIYMRHKAIIRVGSLKRRF